ncbi:hypothetical protein [Pedobacter sp. UYEF25]
MSTSIQDFRSVNFRLRPNLYWAAETILLKKLMMNFGVSILKNTVNDFYKYPIGNPL